MKIIHKRRWPKVLAIVLAIFVVFGAYSFWALSRSLPTIKPTLISIPKPKPVATQLAWPSTGQAAVGIVGTNIVETNGEQKPAPTASAAKIITALVVLDKKPLTKGQQGPIITMTADDVARYQDYAAKGGSVVRVSAGEQISEYQMLQAIMLPSANNIADSLAVWAFGSMANYKVAANAYLSSLGLSNTKTGSDASGLAPDTTSTALDLVHLGKAAMENPVLAEIVGQPSTELPVAGTVKNVNFLLGTDGVVGIKTGNTEEAGGVFVSAANTVVDGKVVTVTTAVVGSPSLFVAMKDSLPLLDSAKANFRTVTAVKAGQVVGSYKSPWDGTVNAYAAADLKTTLWGNQEVSTSTKLKPLTPSTARVGQNVGQLIATRSTGNSTVAIKLSTVPTKPSTLWRLTHPF
ncbi:MAG: D-alanyl-D-alanine carboxypeptidase [Patescibacteria group bacterium]